MKRIIWAAAVGLIFFALIVLFSRLGTPKKVSASWVGFTNNPAGEFEALFRVEWDRSVIWNVYALHHRTPGGWKGHFPTPMTWSSYRSGDGHVIGVTVPSTNESWRVVLFCQERRAGWKGLLDRGKEFYERHTTRSIRSRYDGRRYHVTNDLPHDG